MGGICKEILWSGTHTVGHCKLLLCLVPFPLFGFTFFFPPLLPHLHCFVGLRRARSWNDVNAPTSLCTYQPMNYGFRRPRRWSELDCFEPWGWRCLGIGIGASPSRVCSVLLRQAYIAFTLGSWEEIPDCSPAYSSVWYSEIQYIMTSLTLDWIGSPWLNQDAWNKNTSWKNRALQCGH